jgi:hypothetical protein
MEAKDTWTYKGTTYTNNEYCTVFRWRTDYQNDFSARMDRCVKPFAEVNHAPHGVVNNDTTLDMISIVAKPGSALTLDAAASTDPDKNALTYAWYVYKEPGTYAGAVSIADATTAKALVTIPSDADGKSIHVILTVTDNGAPALIGYRRIVITGGIPSESVSRRNGGAIFSDAVIRAVSGKILNVYVPSDGEAVVRVHAVDGKLVASQRIVGRQNTHMALAGPKGAYVVTISRGVTRVTRTVVVR